jgi:hypothetical protein
MVDHYTKAVLTIIAVALTTIAVENGVRFAWAQEGACGSTIHNACYVRTDYGSLGGPLSVKMK